MSTTPAAPASDEETTVITLSLSGFVEGVGELTPETIDIDQLGKYLQEVSVLLRGDAQESISRIPFSIEKGSVKVLPLISMSAASMLAADMQRIQEGNYSNVPPKRVSILKKWDKEAEKNNYKYHIGTAATPNLITISSKDRLPESIIHDVWVPVEKTIEGTVVDAGGTKTPNIHLVTQTQGRITISASKDQLKEIDTNLLYKHLRMRVQYEINLSTKEKQNFKLLHFVIPNTTWDAREFEELHARASEDWKDVKNITAWVEEIRGNN